MKVEKMENGWILTAENKDEHDFLHEYFIPKGIGGIAVALPSKKEVK